MPVPRKRCNARPSPARKRVGCDEECLRRIAVRLCRLHCASSSALGPIGPEATTEDDCATSTDCCDVSGGNGVAEEDVCCASKSGCGSGDSNEIENHMTTGDSRSPETTTVKSDYADGCCRDVEDKSIVDACVDDCCKYESACSSMPELSSCADGCCGKKGKFTVQDECVDDCCPPKTSCSSRPEASNCADGCCGDEEKASPKDDRVDECCKSKATSTPEPVVSNCKDGCGGDGEGTQDKHDCTDNCCKPNSACTPPTKKSSGTDGCCGGETESLAEDDCVNKCCGDKGKASIQYSCLDDCYAIPAGRSSYAASACSKHLEEALNRYENMLLMGRCLCRKVLDQLGVSCCSLGPNGLKKKSAPKRANVTQGKAEVISSVKQDASGTRSISEKESSTCKQIITSTSEPSSDRDVELGAAREHVVVKISGMTCTGCVRKMMNVCNKIPGLFNPSVAFVSESAEFDLDNTIASDDNVLSQIEKETGFKLSRVVSGHQHLDLLMSNDTAKKYLDDCPQGIESLAKQKKNKSYRVTYNPRIVGARSLLLPDTTLAPPAPESSVTEGKCRLRNTLMSFMASTALTIPVIVLGWADTPISETTRQAASLALATFVQAIAVPDFYVGALKSLVYSRVIEMDMLVVISITAAYGYSVTAFCLIEAGYTLEQGPFFETSTLLITLVLLGRLMSAYARVRAVSSVSLRSLQAESAIVIQEDGSTTKLDARLLEFGDKIRIPAHSRVVTDGKVLSGESAIDESMVTGESIPVHKQTGDSVIAGTVNGPGTLDVQLARLPGENSITDIAGLVEKAVGAKPRVQNLADKIASYFIPSVIGLGIVVFAIWIAIAIKIRHLDAGGSVGTAITYGIAVLAVSCPCALGLAVPMVLVIACGVAARQGAIIKAADAIERGFKATDVVFDKTGTLTNGDLQVVLEQCLEGAVASEDVFGLARALVERNEHPVSAAVGSHLKKKQAPTIQLSKVHSIPGAGVQADWKNSVVKAGNPYWLHLEEHPVVAPLLELGMTYLCLTLNEELMAVWGLQSTIRDEAANVISELQRRHITCHIVSGDAPKVVEEVALALGIDSNNTQARRSPAEKQAYVQNLQASGKRVIFCGDGTNDAVAVAQADVGIQIGSASDVMSIVADVILLGGLDGVITLLDVSRQAFHRIRFNFVWTVVYNLFAILLAAGAFVMIRIPPAYAGLGEIVSVSPVILVAVSMVWVRGRH